MKKIVLLAASSFALALAACGDTGDASEDAMADNVEMPADEALADTPLPEADATADAEEAAEDAAADAEAAADAAEQAAADAAAAAEAATEEVE